MEVAASSAMEGSSSSEMKRFRDLPHRSSNEALKIETTLVVKLSETGTPIVYVSSHAIGTVHIDRTSL